MECVILKTLGFIVHYIRFYGFFAFFKRCLKMFYTSLRKLNGVKTLAFN